MIIFVMFRIKNVRNSTVAKQTHILPSINHNLRPNQNKGNQPKVPIKNREELARPGISNRQEQGRGNTPKIQHKLVIPKNQNKVTLISKAHVDDLSQVKKLTSSQLHHKHLLGNSRLLVKKQKKEQKNRPTLKDIQGMNPEKQKASFSPQFTQDLQKPIVQSKEEENQQFLQFVHKQEEFKQKQQEERLKVRQQEQKINKSQQLKRQREIQVKKFQEEQQRKIQTQRLKKQQKERDLQKQKKLQQDLKATMQKVQARRKARQEQRERQRRMDQVLQQRKVEQSNQGGGLIALNDPLAHIEMSEEMMDKQITYLLKMKFTDNQNRAAIENQLEELDRINQSYLMVRAEHNHPLTRGLSNFRTELFNRVGQLVVDGQSQGQSASGLRMVEADYLNRGNHEGVKVTRGLQGHIKTLLKPTILRSDQECPICLQTMQQGQQIYNVNCGHQFHKNCLEDWLSTTANCPACRYNIKFDHP